MSLLRSPWRLLVVVAVLLAGAWAGKTLRLETELLPLMPGGLPSVRGLAEFQRRFASEREVYVVADPAMPEEVRAAAFRLLRPALAAIPGVASVGAPGEDLAGNWPELAAWAVWNLPPEGFARALAAMAPERVGTELAALPGKLAGAPDPEELAKLQLDPLGLLAALGGGAEAGAGSEMGAGLAPFLSGEAPPFLIVRSAQPLANFEECIAMTDAVRGTLARTLPGEHRLLLTGRPAFTAEISRQMRGDMVLMMGAASVLLCAVFWAFYRTLRPLGWILFFQVLALLVGLVVARVCFGSLNVISMGFASILLGVSMDYSILVYHHFASGHRDDVAVWALLRRGIWFSAVTTAASFLVLAFSSFPGLRELAALVAAGLIAAPLFATWLLPVVLRARPPVAPPVLDRAAHAAARGVTRWRRPLLAGAVAVALLGGGLMAFRPDRIYVAGMGQFRPSGSDAYRGQEWLMRSDASAKDAIYLVQGRTWSEVKAGAARLAAQVSGGRMSLWSYLLPAPDHQAANRAAWSAGTVARLRGEFEKAGLGTEWSAPTLALASSLESAAAGEASAFRAAEPLLATLASEHEGMITAVIRLPGSAEQPVPEGGFAAGPGEVLPVSWVSLADELTALARHDMGRLGGWMLAALVVLCTLAQRSLRLVALNFAALLLALLALVVLLAATGTSLSPLSLLSVPLLLGLVIDYSLHILMGLEHSGGELRKTYSHLAAPVLLTGLSSCIGFGAPMLTRQPALRNFGIVMDLGILAAVATCLVVLPLLHRATMRRREEKPEPHAPLDSERLN